ncbi:hypothetical protein [Desulfobulbus oligotrophicus]|uniref:Uncharacterized protein n=1 Tax=Desulfobulbus oligotrophicus TaxID=1909699 RepID=A0A7T5VDM1_9BACT|nr:hypothetical protein [Desulfobulbus oligotrophicus]QQG65866.1 hypothetical protein HP555_08295 [Desulfobulbus oligotrophicus]
MTTKQELHLEILNQEYSRFVKDQVLTEVQLNEIIDFFEDQHRLTRTCLLGTGIVCGLELSRTPTAVTLSPGVAVTTDGDLLRPLLQTYRYFSAYTPPDSSHYDPFYYQSGTAEKMLTLYQLLTEEEKNALNSQDYQPISELNATITNWVALLYLEYYLKDPVKCTPTNCDNLGIRQKAAPKLLICSKEDMDKLIHKDAGETIGDDLYQKYHEAYTPYFSFPVIKAKRVLLGSAITLNSTTLASAYFTAAKNGATPLNAAIRTLYRAFQPLIDPGETFKVETLTKKLSQALTPGSDIFTAQYMYDFYKDVIAAYNELRETLYNVAHECHPNLYAFPKHIMLGAPNIKYEPKPPAYRHQFYPSSAISKNKVRLDAAGSMLARLKLMIETFKPGLTEKIRITPSRDYDQRLAERAIPFYYTDIRKLAPEWSYSKSLKNQVKRNLSYNADQYANPIPAETLNPLDYDIDAYNFFRIEGHMGRPFKDALKELHDLRTTKGLPIDLVAVRLGDVKLTDVDLENFSCYFSDLETTLALFQAEINCLVAEGVTFFSGFTTDPDRPHVNIGVIGELSGAHKWRIDEEQLQKIVRPAAEEEQLNIGTRPSQTILTKRELEIKTVLRDPTGLQTVGQVIFPTKRVVAANINSDELSIGRFVTRALQDEPATTADFVEKTRAKAAAASVLDGLSEDEQYVLFEYPIQIIADLNALQKFIPSSLDNITADLVTGYRQGNETLYGHLQVIGERLENYFTNPQYVQRGFETEYLNTIDHLGRLRCSHEKLEVLFEEIEQRKRTLLEQLTFARFSEQHPGLEHKGGTHRGGTFVLVYADTPATSNPAATGTLVSDIFRSSAAQLGITEDVIGSRYIDTDTFALYIAGNPGIPDKETELNNFLSIRGLRQDSLAARYLIDELNTKVNELTPILQKKLTKPEQGVVVADFCLPYLCCSDCPPIAFIIPREKRILALPTDLACTTDAPIPFSLYSPKGAIIDSPEAPKAIIRGENPAFDPGRVLVRQLYTPITFTLDGETTDCVIVVKRPLDLLLTAEVQSSDSSSVVIVYTNTTDERQSGENTYIWAFNDNSTEKTQGKAQLVKTFSRRDLSAAGITTIAATVTVLDDPCNSTTTVSVRVPAPPVADTCPDTVLAFIAAAIATLTSEDFQTLLSRINLPDIRSLYEACRKLLDTATTAVEKDDSALREQVLRETTELLQQVYPFKFPEEIPRQLPRVLEELLRVLLMLMLNLVRCDQKLSDTALQIILESLDRFVEHTNWLHTYYPQLDTKDILQEAIKAYEADFVSQHARIKEKLQQVLEVLDLFI